MHDLTYQTNAIDNLMVRAQNLMSRLNTFKDEYMSTDIQPTVAPQHIVESSVSNDVTPLVNDAMIDDIMASINLDGPTQEPLVQTIAPVEQPSSVQSSIDDINIDDILNSIDLGSTPAL